MIAETKFGIRWWDITYPNFLRRVLGYILQITVPLSAVIFTSYNTCQCKPPGNTDDHRYADHIIGLKDRRQDQDQQKGRNTSAHFRKPHQNRIHLWTCCSADASVGNTDHSNDRSNPEVRSPEKPFLHTRSVNKYLFQANPFQR